MGAVMAVTRLETVVEIVSALNRAYKRVHMHGF